MISNVIILCAVAEYNSKNRGKSQPLHALQPIDSNKWKQLNDSPLGDQFVGAAKFIFSDVNETYFVVRNKNKIRIMHTINGGAGGENILSILNKIQTDVVIRTLQNECGCDIATDSYQTQLYVKAPLVLNTKRAVHEFATKYGGLEIQRLYNHHFGHKGGIHSLSIGIGRNLDENENNLNNLIAASIQLKEAELKSQKEQINQIERWCNLLVRRCSQLKEEKSVLGTIMRILYEGTETQIKQKILELYLHPFTLLCNATATTLHDISYNETGLAITAMTNSGDCNEAKRLGKKMKNKKYISEAKCVKIAKNKYKNDIIVEFLDEAKYVRFTCNRRTVIEIKEMTPEKSKDAIILYVLSGEWKEIELFRLMDNYCVLILNFNYAHDLFGSYFNAISVSLTKVSASLGNIVCKLSECNIDIAEQHKIIPWLHFIASWCNNYNYTGNYGEWSMRSSHYLLAILFECMGHINYNKLFTSNAMSQVRMADDIFFFLIKVHQNLCVDLFRHHLNDNLVLKVLFAAIKSPQILSSLISINNGGIISILEPLTFQKLQRLDGRQKRLLIFPIIFPQIEAICCHSLSMQVFGIMFPLICCMGNRELFSLLTNQSELMDEISGAIGVAMSLNQSQRPVIN